MTKHTQEPWHIDGEKIRANLPDGGKRMIGTVDDPLNILRVTQCINALAGIEDPAAALTTVREALTAALLALEDLHGLAVNLGGVTGYEDESGRAKWRTVENALALLKGEA